LISIYEEDKIVEYTNTIIRWRLNSFG
jgi:hypothetical protein